MLRGLIKVQLASVFWVGRLSFQRDSILKHFYGSEVPEFFCSHISVSHGRLATRQRRAHSVCHFALDVRLGIKRQTNRTLYHGAWLVAIIVTMKQSFPRVLKKAGGERLMCKAAFLGKVERTGKYLGVLTVVKYRKRTVVFHCFCLLGLCSALTLTLWFSEVIIYLPLSPLLLFLQLSSDLISHLMSLKFSWNSLYTSYSAWNVLH